MVIYLPLAMQQNTEYSSKFHHSTYKKDTITTNHRNILEKCNILQKKVVKQQFFPAHDLQQ